MYTTQQHQLKIEYKRCPHCQTNIALTLQNPDGKCPFRFCKGYGYHSMDETDKNIDNKYNGECKFSYHLGDAIMCIETVFNRTTLMTNLVCLTIGYPGIFIISPEEFNNIQ